MNTKDRVRKCIDAHIKAGGLVTAPESLTDAITKAVEPKKGGKNGATVALAMTDEVAGMVLQAIADRAYKTVDGHEERTLRNLYLELKKIMGE